jgi:hypothetical protein
MIWMGKALLLIRLTEYDNSGDISPSVTSGRRGLARLAAGTLGSNSLPGSFALHRCDPA